MPAKTPKHHHLNWGEFQLHPPCGCFEIVIVLNQWEMEVFGRSG
jgi:hypothetical protein